MTGAGLASLAAALQAGGGMEPLPAEPPIGGPFWTLVVPGVLFLGALLGTWMLYRAFAGDGE